MIIPYLGIRQDPMRCGVVDIIESLYATRPGHPVTRWRPWRERLFTWPWRPWVSSVTWTPQLPACFQLSSGTWVCHPAAVAEMRRHLAAEASR